MSPVFTMNAGRGFMAFISAMAACRLASCLFPAVAGAICVSVICANVNGVTAARADGAGSVMAVSMAKAIQVFMVSSCDGEGSEIDARRDGGHGLRHGGVEQRHFGGV